VPVEDLCLGLLHLLFHSFLSKGFLVLLFALAGFDPLDGVGDAWCLQMHVELVVAYGVHAGWWWQAWQLL